MTAKEYKMMAVAFTAARCRTQKRVPDDQLNNALGALDLAIDLLADELVKTNKNFDRNLFNAACHRGEGYL